MSKMCRGGYHIPSGYCRDYHKEETKMSEEELQTKVFYSLGQAEVSSSERVLKIGDELMQAIHSYTQERELEVWQEVLDAWDLEEYAKVRITELQAQLNKSKGEQYGN